MSEGNTVVQRVWNAAKQHPDTAAILSKNSSNEFEQTTYTEFVKEISQLGAGLFERGVKSGDHVGIISNNRKEWILCDLAILGLGAVDIPRGSDSTADEIAYILAHADCEVTFVENKAQMEKILAHLDELPKLKEIILLDAEEKLPAFPERLLVETFDAVLELGREKLQTEPDFFNNKVENGKRDDLATIIYTSGTTGEPKGVMLTHESFLFQLERIYDIIHLKSGEIFISVLPAWHSYERAVEYIVLNRGAAIAYSKPIGKILLKDMETLNPQWMTSVPRIWEGVYSAIYRNVKNQKKVKQVLFHTLFALSEMQAYFLNMFRGLLPQKIKRYRYSDIAVSIIPLLLLTPFRFLGNILVFKNIQLKLGKRFRAGVSGGGAMPPHVDRFFHTVGITVLEGYGLTETGPILSSRITNRPILETVGPFLRDIEYRVIGKDGEILGPGQKGVLYVKSPQVMQGYYKRPDATKEVLQDGWLNTGDLVKMTYSGEIRIKGRAKDTIVLIGGENIEPGPIESKLLESEWIDQTMIVGQDKKFLAALIVPHYEKLEDYAVQNNLVYVEKEELLGNPEIQERILEAIQEKVNTKTGFKHFEQIFRFKLLPKPFEVGQELTLSMKLRRHVIQDMYRKEIREIFK